MCMCDTRVHEATSHTQVKQFHGLIVKIRHLGVKDKGGAPVYLVHSSHVFERILVVTYHIKIPPAIYDSAPPESIAAVV